MFNKERVMRLSNLKVFCTLQLKTGSLAISICSPFLPYRVFANHAVNSDCYPALKVSSPFSNFKK